MAPRLSQASNQSSTRKTPPITPAFCHVPFKITTNKPPRLVKPTTFDFVVLNSSKNSHATPSNPQNPGFLDQQNGENP